MNAAIFASGNGTNAENLIRFFNTAPERAVKIELVITNRPNAKVLKRAENLNVKTMILTDLQVTQDTAALEQSLKEHNIQLLLLAGWLKRIPSSLIALYPNRIINIHPSLLPSYGGKGMYGDHVHKAVLAAKEQYSGITIHLADEQFDHGKILYQGKFKLAPDETLESLKAKIHAQEQADYPRIVQAYAAHL